MTLVISILGEVAASSSSGPVELGPQQQRALLALLAIRGEPVSLDTIIDTLWPDDPPASAAKIVQTYVSRLRKTLGQDAIDTRGHGYALALPRDAIDVHTFEQLSRQGRLVEALAVWRGPALADVRSVLALAEEADRLDDERLSVLERRIDLDLAGGASASLISELRTLVSRHPMREKLVGQLMLALYRDGQQTEALELYTRTRDRLADELGLEPGPQLNALQQQILAHDGRLAPEPAPERRPTATEKRPRRRTHRAVLAAAMVVVALAITAAALSVLILDGEAGPVSTGRDTIARIDPKTSKIVESIAVGRNPGSIAATAETVWVVNETDGTLSRVDTGSNKVETIGRLPHVGIVTTDERGYAYVSGFDDAFVSQVDPNTLQIVRRIRVKSKATGLAVGGGSLWVVDRPIGWVRRIDLATGKIASTIPVGADPIFAAFGYGALWVVNSDDATVSVIRPGISGTQTIPVTARALAVATGEHGVWVADQRTAAVTRIDPDTHHVVDEIDGAARGSYLGVAAGGDAVWLTDPEHHEIIRIDD